MGWQCATAQRRLVLLSAEFADGDEWLLAGSPTAAHWIADALDVELCTAREWIRIGRALGRLPHTDAAFASQEVSYSKVRQLTRVANADNEAELLEVATRTPAGRLGVALAHWLARHETDAETEERHHRDRRLSWRTEVDGMVSGSFRLPPAHGAPLIAAIDTRIMRSRPATQRGRRASAGSSWSSSVATAEGEAAWPTLAQQRADALTDLIGSGAPGGVTTEVVLHVRGDGCTLDDGSPIAGSIVERLVPESFVSVLIHDAHRRPINASGRQRHPTRRQRRVVRERDRVCLDCGSTDLLEFDHVPDFEVSRRTLVDELEQRCAPCHQRRHQRASA
ncbi:MAG TPA: DUF222 domain-containing protein [Microthrixaceae bacterium]|nr:DUF222 domain-containing protein [Microthrixaceae bacterium]